MDAHAILVSADDAAAMLSVTTRRLLRLARNGRIPSVDLGDGELRFCPDQLRAWVREQQRVTEGATNAP